MRNDEAWERLFADLGVLEKIDRDGFFIVSARQMKKYREPRLMAKFDHESNLPALFRKHSLAILPISRGEYVVSPFTCYLPLVPDEGAVTRLRLPEGVTCIDPGGITSEATAINCAAASGIFSDFLGEERLIPAVSGRMGSGEFSFRIVNSRAGKEVPVRVDNAQIEIDAGFEGAQCLALVEAKLDISDDFIVRQLFYPFKTWEMRTRKPVRLVYMVYTNGIFTMYEYAVGDREVYNSLRLVKSGRYCVEETGLRTEDIERVIDTSPLAVEPEDLPFPQADSFERVVNMSELLNREGETTYEAMTRRYGFTPRQTGYYTNSLLYLGLAEKSGRGGDAVFRLTEEGREAFRYRLRERQLKFCECILRHTVFREACRKLLESGKCPDRDSIVSIMKNADLSKMRGEATYARRASTVSAWLNWIDRLLEKGLFALPPEKFK